jgi:hypothetical protein
MPRGHLTKDIIKTEVLKLKAELGREGYNFTSDPKSMANKYLNKVLDKIDEYAN